MLAPSTQIEASTLVHVPPDHGPAKLRTSTLLLLTGICLLSPRCSDRVAHEAPVADRTVVTDSLFPVAVDPDEVGRYPALAKAGGGHFYDDVLEYRVWYVDPEGGEAVYRAFASYEKAVEFRANEPTAEKVVALVRQEKWLEEPQKGNYRAETGERITEWPTDLLLQGRKRGNGEMRRFLAQHGSPQP